MASLSQDSSSRVTSGRKVSSVARRARAEARQKKKAMGEKKGRSERRRVEERVDSELEQGENMKLSSGVVVVVMMRTGVGIR